MMMIKRKYDEDDDGDDDDKMMAMLMVISIVIKGMLFWLSTWIMSIISIFLFVSYWFFGAQNYTLTKYL